MRILLSFLFLTIAVGTASAQNPRGYIHFKFDPDVEALVKDRLKLEHDLGPFKDLLKQILANPDKLSFDAQKFKDAKFDDPAMKKALRNWLDQDPDLKKNVEKWLKKLPADKQVGEAEKWQQRLKSMIEQGTTAKANPEPPPAKIDWPRADDVAPPAMDPVAKAAKRMMQQAEDSGLGKWLSDSPGWQRALENLQTSIQRPEGSPWQTGGDWQKRLGFNEQKAWQFGADTLRRLQNMPRPNFEGTKWNRTLPGVGALPTLTFGPPAMPTYSPPSLPSVSTAATWALLILATLLIGWQMMRWTGRAAPSQDDAAKLGPWPIQPQAVSTRADLVQAFDYLALRTLGYRVRSWNHQAVAHRWCEQMPGLAPVAQSLAALYEASRYTDGSDDLAPPQREQARQALAQLAEALK